MKKNDFILLVMLLSAAGLLYLFYQGFYKRQGEQVVIYVNNQEYLRESLNKDQIIKIVIQGKVKNQLEIKKSKVKMTGANCPDKLCMRQKEILYQGESIICLPNKVVVEIVSKKQKRTDAVAKKRENSLTIWEGKKEFARNP